MTSGPFEVSPQQIESLSVRFTEFVNRLLALEASAHGLRGHLLTVNIVESKPDGGVDAAIRNSPRTDWLPEGDTAWQFKRSNIGPADCAEEVASATWAHQFLKSGGTYVLALGTTLTDNMIEARRQGVVQKAIELALLTSDDPNRIRVYDANALARWASLFPSLAVSQLMGGPGPIAIDYERWSNSRVHATGWVADTGRQDSIDALRQRVHSSGIVELRVHGESGIGKTRLVLEALREDSLQPLVVYVPDERSVDAALIGHLIEGNRTAILVVDECPADRHVKLAELLPNDPAIRLLTIGDSGSAATRTPIVQVDAMPNEQVEEFLKTNYGKLSNEARRFVTDHSRGNLRWTIVLAERVVASPDAQAADLIAKDDIVQFVTSLLPEGRSFFFATILAIFERVGWEGNLRSQLEKVATFAQASLADLDAVGTELAQLGVLVRQGRYRAISPHPLAVFLAAEAWKSVGERIQNELLSDLDGEMALALFGRVADLGRFEPVRSVLPQLIEQDGPFSSLQSIESGGLGQALTQLAIALPDELTVHLAELIEAASVEELAGYTASRRDLVWTLEKLVWHRRTFEAAANCLLKLALAENETYTNNATGTWMSLFGALLPATAALPDQRIAYLRATGLSDSPETRMMVVKAAGRALESRREWVGVSGELQGGALVETRGGAGTWAELEAYRAAAIELLQQLSRDPDAPLALAAEEALLNALHPLIDDPHGGSALADALVGLRGQSLRKLRAEIEHLTSLHERHPRPGERIVQALNDLAARLPEETPSERLAVLVRLRRWDLEEGELQRRIEAAYRMVPAQERSSLFELLTEDLPAAWEYGRAVAVVEGESSSTVDLLVENFDRNPEALLGYLGGLVESGIGEAFDQFLDSEIAQRLSLRHQIAIATRGPVTESARNRILTGLRALSVAEGTFALFGWQRNLSTDEVSELLEDWTNRISSQADYNGVIDWLMLQSHGQEIVPESLLEATYSLLMMRSRFPDASQQSWDWAQLAGRFVRDHGLELANLIFDLVDSGHLMLIGSEEEAQLLSSCAQTRPKEIWKELARRIQNRAWRLQMSLRGWFLNFVPVQTLQEWLTNDVDAGRLIASLASAGGSEPSPAALLVLTHFGEDEEVRSSLSAEFMSGSWVGPESARLDAKISQMNEWRANRQLPPSVRSWAGEMSSRLEAGKAAALIREAERGY